MKIGLKVCKGDKYFKLSIIKEVDPYIAPCGHKSRKFLCVCDCGNKVKVQLNSLRRGLTTSCGCKSIEQKTKHGLVKHPLYSVHQDIIKRCYNSNSQAYKNYGGRGIKVCKSWHNVKNFINWADNNGYRKGLFIDRRNNDKNYSPSNCRWVTTIVNNNNRRTCLWVIDENKIKMSFKDFWRLYSKNGVKYKTAIKRFKAGTDKYKAVGVAINKKD